MEFDTDVRLAVYRHFASTGQAPSLVHVAAQLACSEDDVRMAFARLRARRVLLLEPDGETVRMAPPFSGVPTPHTVAVGRQTYFATCAWDALGTADFLFASHPLLIPAVRQALGKARFEPARRDGTAIPMCVRQAFRFTTSH